MRIQLALALVTFVAVDILAAAVPASDVAAQGERLRALIAEKAPRLRDYEKAAYVAALEQGGESVDWALRNLAASEDPSSRADSPRSIDRCVGVVAVSC